MFMDYLSIFHPLALPLGELSPKVTERALQPLLNGKINLCADTVKIPVNVPIGEP